MPKGQKPFRVSMSLIESQGVEPSGLSENQALSFVGGVLPIEISKKSPNREVVLSPGIKAHKSLTSAQRKVNYLSRCFQSNRRWFL
jgi:hypothetical protein